MEAPSQAGQVEKISGRSDKIPADGHSANRRRTPAGHSSGKLPCQRPPRPRLSHPLHFCAPRKSHSKNHSPHVPFGTGPHAPALLFSSPLVRVLDERRIDLLVKKVIMPRVPSATCSGPTPIPYVLFACARCATLRCSRMRLGKNFLRRCV